MRAVSSRIAILGAGRLGESLLRGFLSSGWRAPSDLVATSRRPEHVAELRERYGIEATSDNAAAVEGAGLVILAVKPQDMPALLAEIAPVVSDTQTLLSVAAGTVTPSIEGDLPGGARVGRAVPNAPAPGPEGGAGGGGGGPPRAGGGGGGGRGPR